MSIYSTSIGIFFISVLSGLLLTFVIRRWAVSRGIVAAPKSDRWHKRPTAMLGGVAIFLTTVILFPFFVPLERDSLVVMGASTLLFLVGLVDDLINIRPYQKLIGQLAGAAILVLAGLTIPLTGIQAIDISITVFWVIGITNAINLLDNMDGLAAGISAIAAVSLALSYATNGQVGELYFAIIFIGALLGFLTFNFNPASIFMGDCGSLFVGFLLSSLVLLNQTSGRSRGILPILAVPVLILFIPIFDTTFVTILRKLWGRKASQGGRDHTSHRLVALGLSEQNAVLMLYAFATIAGALALAISQLALMEALALIAAFSVILVIIGVYLSKVKVYDSTDEELAARDNAVFAFLINVSHKRRIFEVFLDVVLISLSLYAAFTLVLGKIDGSEASELFLQCLPIVVIIKLGAFLAVGVYRGLWRYTSLRDFVTFAKGVALGSILSVLAILLIYRFQSYSRTVFVVDAILLLVALIGSRMTFRLIRNAIPHSINDDQRQALIYGAGDGGEMVLRELRNNPAWNLSAIGFVDDDPLKSGKLIHGLKVYAGNGSFSSILENNHVDEVLIASRNIPNERLKEIRRICLDQNISLKRAHLKIEPFTFD